MSVHEGLRLLCSRIANVDMSVSRVRGILPRSVVLCCVRHGLSETYIPGGHGMQALAPSSEK